MIDSTTGTSLLDIEKLAADAARELTESAAWPKPHGMLAWFGATRTDNGQRRFTAIGYGLWLGTDGRLWYLFSRNWWMHAWPVTSEAEEQAIVRAKAIGRHHVPEGLSSHDLLKTVRMSRVLSTPQMRDEFRSDLQTRVAKLKAKAARAKK